MKKFVVLLLALLLLTGCGGGYVRTAGHTIDSVGTHTERDVMKAMDAAEKYFSRGFDGCVLIDVRYDGDVAREAEAEWARQYGVTEVVLLESDFRTGTGTPSLNPNSVYRNWEWIVGYRNGGWEVLTCGYG